MDIISTEKAPQALGPYSQAIRANGFIFCSGQIPIDPAAGAVVATTAADQARQAITNLRKRLYQKIFAKEGSADDMNQFLRLFPQE